MREAGRLIEKPEYAGRVSSYVPTRGRQGFVDDLVSAIGISTGLENINAGFCDEYAFQALERLVHGQLIRFSDLQEAEAALQSLMFFDHTALLSPAWGKNGPDGKYWIDRPAFEGNMQVYEQSLPTEIISDQIIIGEYLSVSSNNAETSTLENSSMVGSPLPASSEEYMISNAIISGLLAAYPAAQGIPAYFANPSIQQYFEQTGSFANRLYQSVNMNLMQAGEAVPGSTVEVRLPLFVWALLDRVNCRKDIPSELLAMREELQEARAELAELDGRMKSLTKQNERVEVARYYTEAFEKIVAALHQSNFSYAKHIIYSIINTASLSLPDAVLKAVNPNWRPKHPKSYVRRSVAAKSFLELVDLENARHIVETLDFSENEKLIIARGY